MACGDFKDLKRRTYSDKSLRDKALNITKNPKYDRCQRALASVVYYFFDKKSTRIGVGNNEIKQNLQLAEELHKPIIWKFKKRKVYSGFKDNIWGADLSDIQLISKINKGFRFLLSVIDIFSNYAWVIPLKDKKGVSTINGFQKTLKESDRSKAKSKGRKLNKIWVDKGSEFYNTSFKKWLKDDGIEMYSIHNEGISVVAERIIGTLKTKSTDTWLRYRKMCILIN